MTTKDLRIFKFSDKALMVIKEAVNISRHMKCEFIGTEHILLGICSSQDSIAGKILSRTGITFEKVFEYLKNLYSDIQYDPEDYPEHKEEIPFSPLAWKIINKANFEMKKLGHSSIGTEELLMALLGDSDSMAVKVFIEMSIDPQKFNDEFIRFLIGEEFSAKNGDLENVMHPFRSGNNAFPGLIGYDMVSVASEGKYEPVLYRDNEISRILNILARRTKNSICLVGEQGVGKNAIVEGLAFRLACGHVPSDLANIRLIYLDVSNIITGLRMRGEVEDKVRHVLIDVFNNPSNVIVIDDIHNFVSLNAAETGVDFLGALKPIMSKGILRIIGITTNSDYKKYIEKDPSLDKNFQKLFIEEPSAEATVSILKSMKDKFSNFHHVDITDNAIEAAVTLSSRYIHEKYLPQKAIELIDEAAAAKRLSLSQLDTIKNLEIEKEINRIKSEKKIALKEEDFSRLAELSRESEDILIKNKKLINNVANPFSVPQLTSGDVENIISVWTGIPISRLGVKDNKKLKELDINLKKRIVGQDEAISVITGAIRRGRMGIKDPLRPIGSFIFLGPTGVGKTELCKVLAEELFDDMSSFVKIDMSEYMEKHSVSRFIGSPPGYIGYEEGGQLTEIIRKKPYCVLLFDEIEKAHPDVFNILLQIMDEGRLTDSKGRTVDFKNCIIIMTSNVGARNITDKKKLGFAIETVSDTFNDMKVSVMDELKKTFRPEFINRVDDIVVFKPLSKENIRDIAVILLSQLSDRMARNGIILNITEAAYDLIAEKGYDPVYGARPIKRAIQVHIEDKLADYILANDITEGNLTVDAEVKEGVVIYG